MIKEAGRTYVLGVTGPVLHVLEEFAEQHPHVANDPDLAERLANAILLLRDFVDAAHEDSEDRHPPMVVLEPGKPLDPAAIELMAGLPPAPEPPHHAFSHPWDQQGRTTISVTEAATYIVDVVNAVRSGAEITLTLNGMKSARLVPYAPVPDASALKPFDPAKVRALHDAMQTSDIPAAEIMREARSIHRFQT